MAGSVGWVRSGPHAAGLRGGDVSEHEVHIDPVDVAVAVSAGLVEAGGVAARRAAALLEPLTGTVLRPRWLPRQLQPGRWLEEMGGQGEARRAALAAALGRRLDVLVPVVLTELLRRADLTDLVLRYVDLDDVVRRVDVAAVVDRVDVAAVVDRVDVDPIVARVDLDAVAQRLDLDAVVARLDLTSIVLERVDLDRVVGAVLDRIDLIAARRRGGRERHRPAGDHPRVDRVDGLRRRP